MVARLGSMGKTGFLWSSGMAKGWTGLAVMRFRGERRSRPTAELGGGNGEREPR